MMCVSGENWACARAIGYLTPLCIQVVITSYQTLTMDIPKAKKNENGNGRSKEQDDSDIDLLSSDTDTLTSQRRSVYVFLPQIMDEHSDS